jgi:hypothetical protein
MKDIYKNQYLYYILIPAVVAIWPLLVWAVYLPGAEHNLNNDIDEYNKAQKTIESILSLDVDRLKLADAKKDTTEFDYVNEVYRIAALSGIQQTNCKVNSGIIMKSGEQKSQSAKVTFTEVDIVRFTKFLSTIQFRWADLQCTKVSLNKKKGMPDSWEAELAFIYYY